MDASSNPFAKLRAIGKKSKQEPEVVSSKMNTASKDFVEWEVNKNDDRPRGPFDDVNDEPVFQGDLVDGGDSDNPFFDDYDSNDGDVIDGEENPFD